MSKSGGNSKFVDIVDEIRQMIASDGLLPGDKIPSERELSERLSVGRSSVREALRALELLGLIETRRGEGTFLRDFSDHQLVQLLSTFILQNDRTKQDVRRTKEILEMGCLALMTEHPDLEEILAAVADEMEQASFTEEQFFRMLMKHGQNELLTKIWLIVSDYAKAIYKDDRMAGNKQGFHLLLDTVKTKNLTEIFQAYKNL
ncbi:DNA-binding FadR family transcriptional regulator [Bacillus ectoiniformans]|uniref:FadR/GntR family transcriptional regulator n=1 Tax=Bacillus ectoiniformans TaxID=1494429 RepID=UPI0030843DAC|nr:DNA-binding FadR family transcriptional regulator [Bacillus ectoiniformans]